MKFWILLLVFILFFAGMGYGAYWGAQQSENVSLTEYTGKITFETEAGWGDFKRELGRADVHIRKVIEYTSEPPVVVIYDVYTKENADVFPYGEGIVHYYLRNRTLFIWCFTLIISVPIVSMFLYALVMTHRERH